MRDIPRICGGRMSRRAFIARASGLMIAGCALPSFSGPAFGNRPGIARYWEKMERGAVRCMLCPHGCVISEGRRGICGVRENNEGSLESLVYGYPCALHLDPVEKKPFYHVLPGSATLSLSTVGCNMKCMFCQNWQISQSAPEDVELSYRDPDYFIVKAKESDASSITYTYGEPVVFIEYMQDIAHRARASGLKNFVVTNGYYNEKPLVDLCGLVDAIKVDLKSFDESYYTKICSARLSPVLDSLVRIRSEGVWLEIVYLMVPSLNDDPVMIGEMASWLMGELGPDVPVHFSRFFPSYRLANLPPTPVSSLERARNICMDAGLNYVYIGNVPRHVSGSTLCPACSGTVISRSGYRITSYDLTGGKCIHCGNPIPGVWREE
jgi:pyruvate formate lyase activating enzyme